MKILKVVALFHEYQSKSDDVLYTGMGSVNASVKLCRRLHDFLYPDLVLNLGTVGSITEKGLVQCSSFLEDRFMADSEIPSNSVMGTDKFDFLDLPKVICQTGNHFVERSEMKPNLVYDMEAYSLARVCEEFDVPFLSIKYISDDGSKETWEKSLNKMKNKFDGIVKAIEDEI